MTKWVTILTTKCGHRFDNQMWLSALHCAHSRKICAQRHITNGAAYHEKLHWKADHPNLVIKTVTTFGHQNGDNIWLPKRGSHVVSKTRTRLLTKRCQHLVIKMTIQIMRRRKLSRRQYCVNKSPLSGKYEVLWKTT